ncbi:ABC transporter substrate-binding protein [Ruminiclostridium josui]|uniref:ABC transporter substrate-binding protein n=1 Tax=Ruminiclostridium josui TaxID=1499 RepID=UPI000466A07E|nr:ABC transporter substrate-binding protein [Ruminiclostridium josui]
MKYIKNRIRVIISVALTTMLILGAMGCGNKDNAKDAAASDDKSKKEIILNVGDFQSFPTTAHTAIAENNGYFDEEFKKDNITVKVYRFINGPAINEAFASGAIDVAPAGDQPTITGIANSKACKIIAIGERAKGTSALFVRSDSKFTDISQVKGKKVAVSVGTYSQKILNQWLEKAGLQESDINLVNIQSASDVLNALVAGNVDFAVNSLMAFWDAYSSGKIKKIIDNEENPAYVTYVARNEYLKEHPDIVVRYLKVLDRAYEWQKTHIKETAAISEKITGMNAKSLEVLLPKVDLNLDINAEDIDALGKTNTFMINRDLVRGDFNIKDYIDDSFIKKALGK